MKVRAVLHEFNSWPCALWDHGSQGSVLHSEQRHLGIVGVVHVWRAVANFWLGHRVRRRDELARGLEGRVCDETLALGLPPSRLLSFFLARFPRSPLSLVRVGK